MCGARRTMPAKRKMVIGARFRSPTNLSILIEPTVSSDSSRQSITNVEFGLSFLEMTAVSYVIWEIRFKDGSKRHQSPGGGSVRSRGNPEGGVVTTNPEARDAK